MFFRIKNIQGRIQEKGFICIKGWALFADFISLRPIFFTFIGYLKTGGLEGGSIEPPLDRPLILVERVTHGSFGPNYYKIEKFLTRFFKVFLSVARTTKILHGMGIFEGPPNDHSYEAW